MISLQEYRSSITSLAALIGGATWLAACFTLRRLPGLTGDIYGAICEVMEVLVLLVFTARAPV